jgi:cell division protein FtsB
MMSEITPTGDMMSYRELAGEYGRVLDQRDALEAENARLRRRVDNIKIRSYELNQEELHNMALDALQEAGDE